MTLQIRKLGAGPLDTNTFVVFDDLTRDGIVIDAPPASAQRALALVAANDVTVHQLVLTHGHWDHIVDAQALATALEVPIAAHEGVRARLERPDGNAPVPVPASRIDRVLTDGDAIGVGSHQFRVLYLPGHDEGHIGLHGEADGVLFGGDVLFPGGHGRTDIPGSDRVTMNATLRRLLALPDATVFYVGHGVETTLGAEREWIERIRN